MPETTTATESFTKLLESEPWRKRRTAFAIAMLLVGVDFLAGPELIIPAYFIVPVMLLAWNWGVRSALTLAVVLTLTHFALLHCWGVPPAGAIGAVNVFLRGGVLALLAFVTARLGALTRASRQRVHTLEGMLSACAFCKDIRSADGSWEKIEAYIRRHTDAEFSHGVCPPCAERHYGIPQDHPCHGPEPDRTITISLGKRRL